MSGKKKDEEENRKDTTVAADRGVKIDLGNIDIYGMKILAREIEDKPANYTRFFVLSHEDSPIRSRAALTGEICRPTYSTRLSQWVARNHLDQRAAESASPRHGRSSSQRFANAAGLGQGSGLEASAAGLLTCELHAKHDRKMRKR
jgi:hypothetical protein